MNSSIIHDNICSFIHNKCHPNSYYSDNKYHMTLNIIFSIVVSSSWSRSLELVQVVSNLSSSVRLLVSRKEDVRGYL